MSSRLDFLRSLDEKGYACTVPMPGSGEQMRAGKYFPRIDVLVLSEDIEGGGINSESRVLEVLGERWHRYIHEQGHAFLSKGSLWYNDIFLKNSYLNDIFIGLLKDMETLKESKIFSELEEQLFYEFSVLNMLKEWRSFQESYAVIVGCAASDDETTEKLQSHIGEAENRIRITTQVVRP